MIRDNLDDLISSFSQEESIRSWLKDVYRNASGDDALKWEQAKKALAGVLFEHNDHSDSEEDCTRYYKASLQLPREQERLETILAGFIAHAKDMPNHSHLIRDVRISPEADEITFISSPAAVARMRDLKIPIEVMDLTPASLAKLHNLQ